MNVLTILEFAGQLNALMLNELELNGLGGTASLVLDSMGDGSAFGILIAASRPFIRDQIYIPPELRRAKAR
jgi:hypothetical protein